METARSVRYRSVLETRNGVENGVYQTYGLLAEEEQDGEWHCKEIIHDVVLDGEMSMEMVQRCHRNKLSPIHFRDIIEDCLV